MRQTGAFEELSAELLRLGHRVRFRPSGHSMHPTIRDGESVTVEPARASDLRRGDIVLYLSARGPLAHRLVSMEEGSDGRLVLLLRGDACRERDAPVAAAQIVGRVVEVERRGRRVPLNGLRATSRRAA